MRNLVDWLGLAVGIGGLVASIVGLIFAFLARRAAKSAETAANEARRALTRTLSLIDVERAVALVSHLKLLHQVGHWNSALELYQYLRRMLSDIYERMPTELDDIRVALSEAIPKISDIENEVRKFSYLNNDGKPDELSKFDEILNDVQQDLEKLQSADIFGRQRS